MRMQGLLYRGRGFALESLYENENSEACDWYTWSKGWETFLWSLDLDEKEAFDCRECPEEILDDDDNELNYDDVEVHIADGIDMGNVVNMVKGKD